MKNFGENPKTEQAGSETDNSIGIGPMLEKYEEVKGKKRTFRLKSSKGRTKLRVGINDEGETILRARFPVNCS